MHTQLDTLVARLIVLLPTLRTAPAGIIACPVDCSENIKLTDKMSEFEFVVDPA
jgi:hypothetical protein